MNDSQLVSVSRIRQIISLIDLTNLNDDCDRAAIEKLCQQAESPAGYVAALCVWPAFVLDAKKLLKPDSPLEIATVVNFPTGDEALKTTCESIDKALEDGADEIDYVLPYTELINGNSDKVAHAVGVVRRQIPDNRTLKVILETGMLENSDLIRAAADIAIDQGTDFIKTSTGKVPVNATRTAATIMLDAIAHSNKNVGFKAAGGIKTLEDANLYLKIAEEQMGQSWPTARHFRFGASGLLQNALGNLDSATPGQL